MSKYFSVGAALQHRFVAQQFASHWLNRLRMIPTFTSVLILKLHWEYFLLRVKIITIMIIVIVLQTFVRYTMSGKNHIELEVLAVTRLRHWHGIQRLSEKLRFHTVFDGINNQEKSYVNVYWRSAVEPWKEFCPFTTRCGKTISNHAANSLEHAVQWLHVLPQWLVWITNCSLHGHLVTSTHTPAMYALQRIYNCKTKATSLAFIWGSFSPVYKLYGGWTICFLRFRTHT